MECSDIRRKFVDYIDGDLSDSDRTLVHDHLTECYLCKEDFDDLRNVLGMCEKALRHPRPVNRFSELGIQAATAASRRGRPLPRHRLRVGELLARLAFAAVVVFMVAASPVAVKAAKWLFTPLREPGALSNGASYVRLGLPAERPFLDRRHEIKPWLGINGDEKLL
jgi:predicted anti-sigma-YlaC factor YlaD